MLKGRDLIMIFDRFVGPKRGSSVAQDARVQVRTPDGRHYDVMSVNYGMSLREIHLKLHGQGLKILAFLVLLIYWGIILLATFLP